MIKKYYFLNGKIVPKEKALLPVLDLGLLRGYGVFDYLRTYNGKPFHLEKHLDRLFRSASYIDLEIPWSREQITQWVNETLKKNNFPESSIRIVITGGPTFDTMLPAGDPTILIIVEPAAQYPPDLYEKGVKLMTYPIQRYFPEAKTLTYIPAVILHKKALKAGYYDGIYLDENKNILEAANSNLFFLIDGKLVTTKDKILYGVTRNVLIGLLKDKYQIVERPVNINELQNISECFLTVSSKEILPVVQIDDQELGNGKPGAQTKKIMEMFSEMTRKY